MRLSPSFLLTAALAAAVPHAAAQSTYGPEISAEDFGQHLRALAAGEPAGHRFGGDYARALRASYVEYQFVRLGLRTLDAGCVGDPAARQASLPDTGKSGAAVVYLAHWQDAAEIAGVLEIAERFTTQRPRPAHPVVFLFTGKDRDALGACEPLASARLAIEPADLLQYDASSLVRELNQLQRQGR